MDPYDPTTAPRAEVWTDETTPVSTLRSALVRFAEARDWRRFHQPRDVAMALSVEAAELLELYLWTGQGQPGERPPPARERLEAEVADVAICLLNFCNTVDIDLAAAIQKKLARNAEKYPVEQARGSALKYSEFNEK